MGLGYADRHRHAVLFVDDEGWASFDQVAAALKRRGIRTIKVVSSEPARFEKVLREPHMRWIADRLFYDEVIALGLERGRRRLAELSSAGAIADALIAEPTLLKIGVQSEHGRMLVASSLASRSTLGAALLNKFEVNEALAAAGVPVPIQISGRCSPSDAVARLGLPLVLKSPTGAAGYGVRIVRTLAELGPALEGLRHFDQEHFYQQYIEGSVVMFSAVLGEGGEPLIEHGFRVEQTQSCLGPSAAVSLYDRKELIDLGRRAAARFQFEGLAELGFLETPDGRLLHMDANLRAWGYIASPLKLGINYLDAYVALLRREPWCAHPPPLVSPSGALRVYPYGLFEAVRSGSTSDIVANAADFLKVCHTQFGSLYCLQAFGQAALLSRRRFVSPRRRSSSLGEKRLVCEAKRNTEPTRRSTDSNPPLRTFTVSARSELAQASKKRPEGPFAVKEANSPPGQSQVRPPARPVGTS